MKLKADIAGEQHEINLKRDGARVVAEIDERSYEIEARASEPGVYVLMVGGRIYECRVAQDAARREAAIVQVGNHEFAAKLSDPKRLRSAQTAGAHADGTAQIIAPMPGKVVRVLVEAGAEVKAGEGVVVVEAMKMQNEMKAPKDGKVAVISTAEGATVNAGDVLAVIE